MRDYGGQISAEFLFLFGVLIIVSMLGVASVYEQSELNLAMSAAGNGAAEGAAASSLAVYPEDTFTDYSLSKEGLLIPYKVDIINISYRDMGHDANYDRNKIQFTVYAKTSDRFDHDELVSAGDRINYNLRKSLAFTFNSSASTNRLYNPVFSPHYVYTTANVKWV